MTSWQKPTKQQVDKALALLVRKESYRHFFERLNNPEWLDLLNEKKIFSTPPDIIPKGEYFSHPRWPALTYLKKMVGHKPEIISNIVKQIPMNDNISVYEDLTLIIAELSCKNIIELLDKIMTIARYSAQYSIADNICKIILKLSFCGNIDEALKVTNVILDVQKDKKSELEKHGLFPELNTYLKDWDYERVLKTIYKELSASGKEKFILLLVSILKKAIRLSERKDDVEQYEDFSTIWRKSISQHVQNNSNEIKSILVESITITSEYLIENKIMTLKEIIELLNKQKKLIFDRIAIHLLSRYPTEYLEKVESVLIDKVFFDDSSFRHEYVELLKSGLNTLSLEKANIIYNFIDAGPDIEEYKDYLKSVNIEPTKDELKKYSDRWTMEHLAWFNIDDLLQEYRVKYESLIAIYGKPKHPDFSSYSEVGWTGPTSPISVQDLRSKDVDNLIKSLKECEFTSDFMSPSMEGLGRNLTQVAKEKAVTFSDNAIKFIGLDATYIRGILYGFKESIKSKVNINWEMTIPLFSWIVVQPREIVREHKRPGMDADPHWGWTRKVILELISEGLNEDYINLELRSEIWTVIYNLSSDPDPTQKDEVKYGEPNMDPLTLSINTTRGEAIHTVIKYALWIRRWAEKEPNAKELISKGFDLMPEVSELLKSHLDPKSEFSLAVRSVYGQWLPQLVLLDENWVKENLISILPETKEYEKFYFATWNTYIVYQHPYDKIYEILKEYYLKAVTNINSNIEIKSRRDSNKSLVEHIFSFYWRGVTKDGLRNILIEKFYEISHVVFKGHAIMFIGDSLYHTKDDVRAEVIFRLKELWEMRVNKAKESKTSSDFKEEFKEFGWWFASSKFDDLWALSQLFNALQVSNEVSVNHEVIKKLTTLVIKYPKEVLDCVDLMIKGDNEGWKIYYWREPLKEILTAGMKTAFKAKAREIINYLGSRGYQELEELLE